MRLLRCLTHPLIYAALAMQAFFYWNSSHIEACLYLAFFLIVISGEFLLLRDEANEIWVTIEVKGVYWTGIYTCHCDRTIDGRYLMTMPKEALDALTQIAEYLPVRLCVYEKKRKGFFAP